MIIAEAGVNHNGDINLAYRLCDGAKKAGADVVKFQTWKTDAIVTKSVNQAKYQMDSKNKQESQYDMLKKLELSKEEFKSIKQYCDKIGIVFASTADDPESLNFLTSLGVPFIKVGSGEIGNISYLRYIGSKKLPIIMSTGMSSLADIDYSLKALREGGSTDITILHCTTSYPCKYQDVNLKAMLTIRDAFHLPVGYSDHTLGNIVSVAAVAMGASIIEKHFTLDKNMEGPDHKASLDVGEFKCLVNDIRNIEKSMGNGIKEPTEEEKSNSKVVLKRIVAKHYIEKGSIIGENDICLKRNERGLQSKYWDILLGRRAIRCFDKDEGIEL